MKKSFQKIAQVFNYSFLLFTLIYWIGVIADDWVFFERYWATNWVEYVGIWAAAYLVYALAYSLLFWGVGSVLVLIYHKAIKPTGGETG